MMERSKRNAATRWRRWASLAVAASLVGIGLATAPGSPAAAAVPAFPDNIVVFPDRDFMGIEGYTDYIGQTVLIEVTRPGLGIVGSTTGVVGGGDIPLEVNHPGGVCWGNGSAHQVTPDIQPGDVVSLKAGNTALGETVVQDAYVSNVGGAPALSLAGNVLTVRGHAGAGVNPAQFEQRIVHPPLKDTGIGRRDVAANTAVLTPSPNGGYNSMVEFLAGTNTFVATYVFDDPAVAAIAAEGQLRAMSWQTQDPGGNRQGLTIAEFGELGGPGMGGCPNGPNQVGPPLPSDITATRSVDGISVSLTWTAAVAQAGTPAITGYSLQAVAAGVSTQNMVGIRVNNAATNRATIVGLDPAVTYIIEVRSMSSNGESFPPARPALAGAGDDTTAPVLTITPDGGSFPTPPTVTLTADEPGADIYYSLAGVDLVGAGGNLSTDPSVIRYNAAFTVSADATLSAAAFDPSGNVTARSATFVITNNPVPAAPTFTSAVGEVNGAALTWAAPDAGAPGLAISGYALQVYSAEGAPMGAAIALAGTATSHSVAGLVGDTRYQFGLRAQNMHGAGAESALVSVTTLGDVVANAGVDRFGITRGTTVSLNGTGSTVTGATYRWTQVSGDPVTITGATTLTPSFVFPFFLHPTTINHTAVFQLAVTVGPVTRSDTVTVTSQPDAVTITLARYRAGELRLNGTGTVATTVLRFHTGGTTLPTGLNGPLLAGAAVTWTAPATAGAPWTWDVRIRNFAGANPGRITVESRLGGVASVPTTTA
ncbi:MAG: fibronectin type III domain-containing protein [Acidimicrobiales bacterium]